MYLGYQNGVIKYYTDVELDKEAYNLEKTEFTNEEYALDVGGSQYVKKDEEWEKRMEQKEKERIAQLFLTGADVERAIYKDKRIDFDDVIKLVEQYNTKLETAKAEYAEKLAQYNIDYASYEKELKAYQEALETGDDLIEDEAPVEPQKPQEPEGSFIDIKALKIELKANNFYRGNPYIDQVGTFLGYTSEDLDYLFINGQLPERE